MAESLEILQILGREIVPRWELWHEIGIHVRELCHAVHVVHRILIEVLHVGTKWLLAILTFTAWTER